MLYFNCFSLRRDLPSLRFSSPPHAVRPQQAWRVLIALASLVTIVPAHAGRPLTTDDAAIVDAGACQLETWIERSRDLNSSWLNPGCNPFGRTELSLGTARLRPEDDTAFTTRQWQVKHLFRAYDAEQTGFALAVGGLRHRQGDERHAFLNGIATVPLAGEARVLHVNLGGIRLHDQAKQSNRATWGIALDNEVGSATRIAVETFGTSGERPNWQLGIRHELVSGRVQIDASVGSAYGRWKDSRVATLGLVFVTPAFLR